MKRLLSLPLALVLVGYATSSCSSSASKDKERNDSTAAEAARLDSIRQDSIARRNFITPDLAFNDLHGDVKKCVCDNNEYLTYTYDENGKVTAYQPTTEVKEFQIIVTENDVEKK